MGRGCPGRRAKGANALLVITLSSVLLVKGLGSSTDFGLQCDFLHPLPHRIESWDVPITKHIPGAAAWAHCGVLGFLAMLLALMMVKVLLFSPSPGGTCWLPFSSKLLLGQELVPCRAPPVQQARISLRIRARSCCWGWFKNQRARESHWKRSVKWEPASAHHGIRVSMDPW